MEPRIPSGTQQQPATSGGGTQTQVSHAAGKPGAEQAQPLMGRSPPLGVINLMATYGYATPYLSDQDLLLIENDGVRYASWSWSDIKSIDDMTFWENVTDFLDLGLMVMSCADYELWMALKN